MGWVMVTAEDHQPEGIAVAPINLKETRRRDAVCRVAGMVQR